MIRRLPLQDLLVATVETCHHAAATDVAPKSKFGMLLQLLRKAVEHKSATQGTVIAVPLPGS